jgi:Restriction endonuclease BglII
MAISRFPQFIRDNHEIHEWRHASAILENDFPGEWQDIVDLLTKFRLYTDDITVPGGQKSRVSVAIDRVLNARGWREKGFDTRVVVDGREVVSPTHVIDCYRYRVALEVEWNNTDPFYDRDLNNFRILFDLRAIDVGILITRRDELQEIFDSLGRGASYGASTTHMSRLLPRLNGGGGGGCPVLVFGISKGIYVSGGRP